ncbi:non-ribosomal peptide synthetase [Streptacidiphilus sp. P02-A3a]|uniref:non-ribosomal peptide synthetase n=1 Tax=Streptacidiphilus sp. P02-A3a TaxID=2704468 RepID=UPI0015FCE8D9|nr:non-ribosomal peptide synthetase [Streptacidiphilus sp. P02-A3a]QMU71700.1 amino acid adenylation domain-containing protein [Streptacidiphilus sp. P02-A3a]
METDQLLSALPAIQRPMWLACAMAPDLPVYNEAECFRLEGELDRPALIEALDTLYLRHPALRSVVLERDGLPYLAALPAGPFPLEESDLRDLPPARARRLGEQAAWDAARRTFDLGTGPLARARLIRCADQEWLLVLVLHHLVSDGDSFRLLFDQLSAQYAGMASAAPQGDPVRAQRSLEAPPDSPTAQADLGYWRDQLADLPERLPIPTDRPLSGYPDQLGERLQLPLEQHWFERVQTTAAALRSSPFAVVTAAVSAVLARLARTEDVVIGSSVNMRSEVEAEELVGYFMKTVPLRLRVEEAVPAAELVRQAQATVLDAMSHCSVELDQMVSALGRPGAGHAQLFQVALELHYEPSELDLPGIGVSRLPVHPGTAKSDFTFHFNATPGVPSFLEYRTELYDQQTVRGLADAVIVLLAGLCAEPTLPVRELPLDDGRQAALQRPWETGPALVGAEAPLPEAVRERAARHPGRPAVVHGPEELTYRQLVRSADLLGADLAAVGVAPGDVVGVSMRRSAAQVSALFGTWSAGAVCAVLDPDLPEDRLRRMMGAVGIRTVLVDADTAVLPAFAEVNRVPARPAPTADQPTADQPTAPVAKVTPDDTAYVVFTSGTSGDPKPVAVRHLSLTAFGQAMDRLVYAELPEPAQVAVNAPFTFDASWQGTQLLRAGHTVHPVPDAVRADPEAMVRFLRDHAVDALDGTPTHIAALVDAGLLDRPGHPPRVLVVGGEAVPAGLWRRLAAAEVRAVNVYGPTEFTVNGTGCLIEDGAARPVIGRPLAGVTAQVLDPGLRPVPIGFPGELYLSGPQLAAGYVGQPERTAERFLVAPDGSRRYATGDVVRRRGDGSLEFLGRRDGQVKLRGYRIELTEIAGVLRAAPGVADAAVVVLGQGGPAAVLHAALAPADPAPRIEQVRAFAATRLPGYMVPASFALLPQLPRTASGKVDTARVAALARTRPASAPADSPSTPARRRLALIWSRLLERDRVDDHDDFFALGGNSLLASRLVRQVEAEFGARLPLRAVFGHRTLAAMADVLGTGAESAAGRDDDHALVVPLTPAADAGPVPDGTPVPDGQVPLVVLHPLGGSLLAYQPLLRLVPPTLPVWGVRSPERAGAGQEPPDVTSMAVRYADELTALVPGRRLALFGWSLGGLIALAVAAELESRGVDVVSVEMWDCGVGTEEPIGDRESVRMALRAGYGDLGESQGALLADILSLVPDGAAVDEELLSVIQDRARPLGTPADAAELPRHFRMIRHQTALFRDWLPTPVRAPLHAVYAEASLLDGSVARTDWRPHTSAPWTDSTVAADHYGMMRPPFVAELTRGLLARLVERTRPRTET